MRGKGKEVMGGNGKGRKGWEEMGQGGEGKVKPLSKNSGYGLVLH